VFGGSRGLQGFALCWPAMEDDCGADDDDRQWRILWRLGQGAVGPSLGQQQGLVPRVPTAVVATIGSSSGGRSATKVATRAVVLCWVAV